MNGRWKRYPAYRESDVEWLGNVPHHWPVRPLKRCVNQVAEPAASEAADLPFLGLEHIESWTGRLTLSAEDLEQSAGDAGVLFASGDILFSKLRPYLAKVVVAAQPGRCTGELLVLKPRHLSARYGLYMMLSKGFIEHVDSSTYGTKMPRANWGFIGASRVPTPPEDEQRAIAAFLDRETARIDALIAKKEELIRLLEEKRTALISHLVTKGLDSTAPMKNSFMDWIGAIPAHWDCKPIIRLVDGCLNGSWGSEPTGDEDVICARVADFDRISATLNVGEEPTYRSLEPGYDPVRFLAKGDVLLEKSGGGAMSPVGFAVLVTDVPNRMISSNFIGRMRAVGFEEGGYLNEVLYTMYHMRVNVKHINQSTGIQNLDAAAYLREYIPWPPEDERRQLLRHIESHRLAMGSMTASAKRSISLLREHRQALITAAVTGQIDVRDEVA